MYADCMKHISQKEWKNFWSSVKKGTAPGRSGITADMMNLLPEENLENFRKLVNGSIDEIITSVIEQYDTEIKRLEEVITTSTELLKEKELLVSDLKKQLKDNEFDEENFNKVSLLKTLSRQLDDLQKENKTLNDSLRLRREHSNSMSEDLNNENMVLSTEEVGNDETHTLENVEDVNDNEQNNEDTNLDMVDSVVIGEEENLEVAITEATNENLELTEDDEDER